MFSVFYEWSPKSLSVVTHEWSSNNDLFNRLTVCHGWDLKPKYLLYTLRDRHQHLRVLLV